MQLEEEMMSNNLSAFVLPQIDELLTKYTEIRRRSQYDDCSDTKAEVVSEFLTSSLVLIHRVAGSQSQYAKQADAVLDKFSKAYRGAPAPAIPVFQGILQSLRQAVEGGYLGTLQELIHAELFADYLEMAAHLLEDGYKDPAAVIIGSTLEEHIRKLCLKHGGIDLEISDSRGTRPKKADGLNAELTKEGVYSKLDQKNITAWLDLRNKAAHGEYSKYTQQQVEILLQSVRDFIARYPA
jgi:hypothetical protein